MIFHIFFITSFKNGDTLLVYPKKKLYILWAVVPPPSKNVACLKVYFSGFPTKQMEWIVLEKVTIASSAGGTVPNFLRGDQAMWCKPAVIGDKFWPPLKLRNHPMAFFPGKWISILPSEKCIISGDFWVPDVIIFFASQVRQPGQIPMSSSLGPKNSPFENLKDNNLPSWSLRCDIRGVKLTPQRCHVCRVWCFHNFGLRILRVVWKKCGFTHKTIGLQLFFLKHPFEWIISPNILGQERPKNFANLKHII